MSFNYDPTSFEDNTTPRPSFQRGDILTVTSLSCTFFPEGQRKDGKPYPAFLNFEFGTDDGRTVRHCVVDVVDEARMQCNLRRLDNIQKAAFGGPVVKKACKMDTLAKRMSDTEMTPFQVTITTVSNKGICNIFVGELVLELSDDDDDNLVVEDEFPS